MSAANDNEVIDDAVLSYIQQYAKPTTTLAHLRTVSSSMMEENELKMSLGRLWRAVKILRSSAPNGQVLYWTEATGRAVASSGVSPDMPPGVEVPEFAVVGSAYKAVIQDSKQNLLAAADKVPMIPPKAKKRNIGLLVPISETASLPMRPLLKGRPGGLRRQSITGKVAMAVFKYRDVRMSIDGVASLCPGIKREDVARVISQLSTFAEGKDYFTRYPGATRYDNTYQWNDQYRYPFSSRYPDDGENVPVVNAEEVEDEEALDHLPPNELTENEVDNEIARLLQNSTAIPTEEVVIDGSSAPQASTVNSLQQDANCAESSEEDTVEATDNVVPLKKPVEEDAAFRAGIFCGGELFMQLDGQSFELTKERTDKLIDLLGPYYMARKAA